MSRKMAIIGGIGSESGLSPALISSLLAEDYHVMGIARSPAGKQEVMAPFSQEPKVEFLWGDLSDASFLAKLVNRFESGGDTIDVYIHQAAKLVLKPFLESDIGDFEACWDTGVKTAVVATKALLPAMLARGKGTMIFTGATASMRGSAKSAPFAAAKFALRALSQSLAREFGPRGIHVAHVIVDGVIAGNRAQETFGLAPKACIQPHALAKVFVDLVRQDASCWTQELDVRPAVERF